MEDDRGTRGMSQRKLTDPEAREVPSEPSSEGELPTPAGGSAAEMGSESARALRERQAVWLAQRTLRDARRRGESTEPHRGSSG